MRERAEHGIAREQVSSATLFSVQDALEAGQLLFDGIMTPEGE